MAVDVALKGSKSQQPVPRVAHQVARMSERNVKLMEDFADLLEAAPDFYLHAIERHVAGLLAVFRKFDRRYFESGSKKKVARAPLAGAKTIPGS